MLRWLINLLKKVKPKFVLIGGANRRGAQMYISKVYIENIRCFEKLTLNFKNGDQHVLWTTLLGDNSTGKTTLLKCIALGLCDESSAAGLLRESEEGFLRHARTKKGESKEAQKGKIKITLQKKPKGKDYVITTEISKKKSGKYTFERLSQTTIPNSKKFPWKDIFICAYGIGRGISGTGDISGYVPISAVYNLFNYAEGLQNPELVIRRLIKNEDDEDKIDQMFTEEDIYEIIKEVLNLPNANIYLERDGIKIEDDSLPKDMSLRDIADGYKSTLQWITDFIGWAISYRYQHEKNKNEFLRGVVLVDALEEHLHPKWQKEIVTKLKGQFPDIQFISTTHSPIIAKSVGKIDPEKDTTDQIILLDLDDNNNVKDRDIGSLKGLDIDQILGSEAFDYQYFFEEEDEILSELSRLASKSDRSGSEERKYKQALQIASEFALSTGTSLFEREVEKEVFYKQKEKISELEQILKKDDKN